MYNAVSRSTQEGLLAAKFGTESAVETYNFISLVKTLGAMYASVNHAVVAQQKLGIGLKQEGQELVICFLERVQEVFSQAYGPPIGWSTYHGMKLVEAVVKGVSSKKLVDLITTYQIPVPFSLVHFRDIVVQFAQHVPQITQEKAEVLMVAGPCFRCKKPGHIANDCVQQREPPTCYRCNKVGHIATKCRVHDMYCTICKNARHVTEACATKRATRTLAATAGSAPKINTFIFLRSLLKDRFPLYS